MDNNATTAVAVLGDGAALHSRAMNSADIEYLWRTSDMFDMPLRIFMMVANLAIDDRIEPRGLKDEK